MELIPEGFERRNYFQCSTINWNPSCCLRCSVDFFNCSWFEIRIFVWRFKSFLFFSRFRRSNSIFELFDLCLCKGQFLDTNPNHSPNWNIDPFLSRFFFLIQSCKMGVHESPSGSYSIAPLFFFGWVGSLLQIKRYWACIKWCKKFNSHRLSWYKIAKSHKIHYFAYIKNFYPEKLRQIFIRN